MEDFLMVFRPRLWGSWVTSDLTPGQVSMLYNDGNQCSSGKRRQTNVRVLSCHY